MRLKEYLPLSRRLSLLPKNRILVRVSLDGTMLTLSVEILNSLSVAAIIDSPSESSPNAVWNETFIPNEESPMAICADAPGDSSEWVIFSTGTGAVEFKLFANHGDIYRALCHQ